MIDWTNAAVGSPAYDVADTWLLFAVADVPGGAGARLAASFGRRLFLRRFDRDEVKAAIPAVVEHRVSDRNMSEDERRRMRRMADWASTGAG